MIVLKAKETIREIQRESIQFTYLIDDFLSYNDLGSNIDNLLSYVVLALSVVGSIDYLLRW
jgi:hypothetical protein